MAFYNWLIGNMGTPGDYIYQSMHWYTVAVIAAFTAAAALLGALWKDKPQRVRKLLVAISVFQLAFEVIWRLIYLFVQKTPIVECWPMYPCNLGGILIPIIALTDNRRGKQLFYLFGFVGGVLTFALPDDIFTSSVMVFPIIKSILQHTGLLLIPVLEYASGTYRPSLKDYGWVITGCFIHVFNCEVIDRWLGLMDDYMFFRSDMPFVIPGVPQFITLSVFAAIVFAVLLFLCDIKGSLSIFRKQPALKDS